MSIESNVSSEVMTTNRRLPFFRWLRLLQLLSLVVVFAGGYGYAKFAAQFQRKPQQVAVNRQVIHVPHPAGQSKQNHAYVQNPAQNTQVQVGAQNIAHSNLVQPQTSFPMSLPAPANTLNRPKSAAITVPTQTNNFPNQSNQVSNFSSAAQQFPNSRLASAPADSEKKPTPTPFPVQSAPTPELGLPPTFQPITEWAQAAYAQTPMQANGASSPEEQAVDVSIAELIGKIHQAKKEDKPELNEKLKSQIAEQFKLRHDAQAKEIEEMEKELDQAKSLHIKRNEKREEIIERRFRQLMNELDDLDWNRSLKSSASQPGYYGTYNSIQTRY